MEDPHTPIFNRRHLSRAQKRGLIAQELRRSPSISNNWLAKLTGVTDKTVAAVRKELVAASEIPDVTNFRGEDGKEYRARSIIGQNPREVERARRALAKLGDEAPMKPLNLLRAEELVRRKRVQAKARGGSHRVSLEGIDLRHCDFRIFDLKPGSVHLIVTDPPYSKKWLPQWKDLGEFAARVLVPGGLFVAYSGNVYLPEVMAALRRKVGMSASMGMESLPRRTKSMFSSTLPWRAMAFASLLVCSDRLKRRAPK